MKISGKNRIGFFESKNYTTQFKTYNPVLGKENDFFINEVTQADCELALQKAQEVALDFAQTAPVQRAHFLNTIADLLEENSQKLTEVYVLESGLPLSRASVELKRTIFQLRSFAELITQPDFSIAAKESADLTRLPNPKPTLVKVWRPIGPVVVFGASNFPFAYSTIGGDSASALAAACPVIVKAHPMHAGTGNLVATLVVEAAKTCQMPDGVFSNLNARGHWLGEYLVTHPITKAVGFTGSLKGGMALYRLAQNRPEPIPFFAEMGSVNPIILLPSAFEQSQKIEREIAQSICAGAGQFCTNPGIIIAQESEKWEVFCENLEYELNKTAPQTMLHPQILENYRKGVEITNKLSKINNVVKTNNIKENEVLPKIYRVEAAHFLKTPQLKEEVFGMHTLLVTCKTKEEMQLVLKFLGGQLTTSFFGTEAEINENKSLLYQAMSQTGRIIFNGVPTGVEVSKAMTHGGPFPASTDARFSAVGSDAIYRFLRPITFQNFSKELVKNSIS